MLKPLKYLALAGAVLLLSSCIEPKDESSPAPMVARGCKIARCGTLCVNENQKVSSACEWTPANACYPRYGRCVNIGHNKCGWQGTPALHQCLGIPEENPLEKFQKQKDDRKTQQIIHETEHTSPGPI